MIQRIQTVYLLLAAVALFSTFLVDIAQFTDAAGLENDLALYRLSRSDGEILMVQSGIWPILSLSVTGALYLVAIFAYRNRKRQMAFVRFSYVTVLLSLVAIWFFVDQNYWVLNLSEPDLSFRVGFYLPFVAFAFSWLANRSIRADEALVKSLDRIR